MALSGIQVHSYINLGSMNDDPDLASWTLLPCIRTENLDLSPQEIEANCRNAGGWEFAVTGLRAGEVSFTYLFDIADPAFQAISNMVLLGDKRQFAIMFNEMVSGAEGFVSPMNCVGYDISRDYDSVVEVTIDLKPFFVAGILPKWWVKP